MKMQITYLGQSGFLVELANKYLIFDYFGVGEYRDKVYEQWQIDPEKLKDKPVYVFCSHSHFDHYNHEINKKWVQRNNIIFILGEIPTKLPHTINLNAGQIEQIEDMKIVTAKSTDEGVCFLIFVDGLVIYHGGDHTDWGDMQDEYKKQIDFLSRHTQTTDVAFAPVCSFYNRRSSGITEAAIYLSQKLGVKNIVPMHANNYAVYSAFREENKQLIDSKIIAFDEIGQKIDI